MLSYRQQIALKYLGIPQYVKRQPIARAAAEGSESDLPVAALYSGGPNSVAAYQPLQPDERSAATDLKREQSPVSDNSPAPSVAGDLATVKSGDEEDAGSDLTNRTGHETEAPTYTADSLDIQFWHAQSLMVLRFQSGGVAAEQADRERLEHKLVNNILFALFPEQFTGAGMNRFSWSGPLGRAFDPEIRHREIQEWVKAMMAGHQSRNHTSLIWCMGGRARALLAAGAGTSPELDAVDAVVDLEGHAIPLIFTEDLPDMLAQPDTKVSVWRHLRSALRSVSS